MTKYKKIIRSNNKKIILNSAIYATTPTRIARGFMLTKKKKVESGIILVIPKLKSKFSCSVTMLFCLCKMDILFVDSNFEVVDKTTLAPWVLSYTPKKKCKYIIESTENKFSDIKVGEKITFN